MKTLVNTLKLATLASIACGSAQAATVLTTSDSPAVPGQPDTATVTPQWSSPGQFAVSIDSGVPATRSVLRFAVPAGVAADATSATLLLPVGCAYEYPYTGYGYSDGLLTVNASQVSIDPAAAFLGEFVPGLFDDIGAGAPLAGATFSTYDGQVAFELSPEGLAALQAAEERFSIGLSLESESSWAYAFECLWGTNVRMVLCTEADEQDGDSISCSRDNCPSVANETQDDQDGDGVGDACDVCPQAFDPEQHDSDGDGIGDVCQDSDLDGFTDAYDNCRTRPNPDQADSDADGEGDACDATPTHDLAAQRLVVARTVISLAAGTGIVQVRYDAKNLRNYPEPFTASATLEGLPANCGITAPPAAISGVLPARGKQSVSFDVQVTCGLNSPRGLSTVTGVTLLDLGVSAGYEMELANNYVRANGSLKLTR